MISVIVAGGSGTRLWPLSTPTHPKHLLKLTGKQSLICYALERANAIGKDVYVVTDASHADLVREQLPKLKDDAFIIEPARRGTASCIIATLDYISKRGHDPDEPIAFLPADHYIRDKAGFIHSFKLAETFSKKKGKIVLVGAKPYYPATGFGYIERDGLVDEKSLVSKVASFKEKPTYAVANAYLKRGSYLWNCGYFVGSLKTFLHAMHSYAPELLQQYNALQKVHKEAEYQKIYLGFESNSIDYALIEKVKDLLVIPASFDWMDLGSYEDLHNASESDERGNHVQGEGVELNGVEQSFIHNHEDKPVAVIGLDNVVVVNTKNGLLVARKDLAQQVGEVSKRFKKGKE